MIRVKLPNQTGKKASRRQQVYLDYAAATPLDWGVAQLMRHYETEQFYNPSALYQPARAVRHEIEQARERVLESVGARHQRLVFTSGSTEANHLAIGGLLRAAKQQGIAYPEIVIAATEHPSVRRFAEQMEREGMAVLRMLPVNQEGVVEVSKLREVLNDSTVAVSVHLVNNEIGIRQPMVDLVKIVRRHRKETKAQWPYVHTDAVQATLYEDLNFLKLGVDAMTISSQKVYGPKGAAVLVTKKNLPVCGLAGGGQEGGLRSGTENVPAIVGGSYAIERAQQGALDEYRRLGELRGWFVDEVLHWIPEVIVHQGPETVQFPHIVNMTFPGIDGELMVIELAERGVMCSARAACSLDADSSHVLEAMYLETSQADQVLGAGSVRFSFGKSTDRSNLEYAIQQIQEVWHKYYRD